MSTTDPLSGIPHGRSPPPPPPPERRHPPIKSLSNNARPSAPSSDVISTLLDSLSTISLPADAHHKALAPYSAPQTPVRVSSRRPSRAQSPRRLDPQITGPALPPVERPPLPVLEAIHSDDGHGGAAEPPVIRTSRRPSGQSGYSTPHRDSRPRTAQSDRVQFGRGPPRPPLRTPPFRPESEDQHRPLPQLYDDTKKPQTTNDASSRSSIDSQRPKFWSFRTTFGSRDSLQLIRSKDAKNKERSGTATPQNIEPASPTRLRTQEKQPQPRAADPIPSRPSREYSSASAIRGILKSDPDIGTPGPSQSPRRPPSSDSFVLVRDARTDSRPQGRPFADDAAARPPSSDGRDFVPSRTSSIRRMPESPTQALKSQRTAMQKPPQSPQSNEPDFRKTTQRTDVSQTDPTVNGLDEDNEVMRRIRQLRAAKEERQRMSTDSPRPDALTLPDPTSAQNGTPSPLPAPDTTDASQQLREAMMLKAHTETLIPGENGLGPSRPMTAPGSTTSTPPMPPSKSPNFSRNMPTIATNPPSVPGTPDGLPASPLRQHPMSPVASRPSSRSRQWPYSDTPPRIGGARHSREHSRGNGEKVAFALYPPINEKEERRSSLDSVRVSIREYLSSLQLSRKITSSEGRRQISFSEVGDPQGYPVFVCIGMGVTRFAMAYYEELATTLKLRLITPERPGIGDSGMYDQHRPPLHWPEDVKDICRYLRIEEFSLLAHSAGAIYAMATAIMLAGHVKCKIHLLAPWIPPSQMSQKSGAIKPDAKAGGLPRSQRFLRLVPTSFLKFTSHTFVGGAVRPKSPGSKGRRSGESAFTSPRPSMSQRGTGYASPAPPIPFASRRGSLDRGDMYPSPQAMPHVEDMANMPSDSSMVAAVLSASNRQDGRSTPSRASEDPAARQRRYDQALTHAIYDLAIRTGGVHIDLAVCFEKTQPIGFRYVDVGHEVVIHHGTNDNRVPLHNIKWLCRVMQKAELKVLEGENHNLMSSAGVMAQVLTDVAREWEAGHNGALNDASAYHSPILGS